MKILRSLILASLLTIILSCSKVYFKENTLINNKETVTNEIITGDFDNDGLSDIVTVNEFGRIVIFENKRGNSLCKHEITDDPDRIYDCPFVIDYNGDGKIDLIVRESKHKIYWFENLDKFRFTKHLINLDYEEIRIMNIADIDNDQDNDLLLRVKGKDQKYESLFLYFNEGGGIYNPKLLFNTLKSFDSIVPIDFDNDSDIDLIISESSSVHEKNSEINCYTNNSYFVFNKHNIDKDFPGVVSLVASDLEMDSDIDIVTFRSYFAPIYYEPKKPSYEYTEELAYYENSGNIDFVKHIIENDYMYIYSESLNIFDYDTDNDSDIIFVPANFRTREQEIMLYKNKSNNHFEKIIISTTMTSSPNSVIIDFDNDNDMDLLISVNEFDARVKKFNSNRLIWIENCVKK